MNGFKLLQREKGLNTSLRKTNQYIKKKKKKTALQFAKNRIAKDSKAKEQALGEKANK